MSMGKHDKYPSNWDQIRKQIYKRDGYTCQKCGAQGGRGGDAELHCHHITPISKGGSNHPTNLITLCWRCHNAQHRHHVPRMSSRGSGVSSSTSSGSPGHDRESMDDATKQLHDLYMETSEKTIDTDRAEGNEPNETTSVETTDGYQHSNSQAELSKREVEILGLLVVSGIPIILFMIMNSVYSSPLGMGIALLTSVGSLGMLSFLAAIIWPDGRGTVGFLLVAIFSTAFIIGLF